MERDYHDPVLLRESVDGLIVDKNGCYVDVTFGGGGHSERILEGLTEGRLIAFDQDDDAKANVDRLLNEFPKRSFTFIGSNFRYLKKFLRLHGVDKVDGVLADLGVSSHQFDEARRGFSIRKDSVLDMRMDSGQSLSAFGLINSVAEKDLIHLLSMYGEIKNARTLASSIISSRSSAEIKTVNDLRSIAMKHAPRGKENKYLAQLFQALRIEVNDEINALKELLLQTSELIKSGGRLVVISYHSLEDRLVKNFINTGGFTNQVTKDFYGNVVRPFEPVNRKVITPNEQEIKKNNRARSARLRIAQRTEWR